MIPFPAREPRARRHARLAAARLRPRHRLAAPAEAPASGGRAAPPSACRSWRPASGRRRSSDVKADPDIRFGALPNGMRYAIRRQAIPAGQAALRLRFDAGSLMETDAQQGLAHFLEHMAFNGSKAVPEGEMVKILERHGLAFGADTNASTDFDETVYKLDLPKTDDDTVDTSLMLLREAACEPDPRPGRGRPRARRRAVRGARPRQPRPTGSSRRGWASCCRASGMPDRAIRSARSTCCRTRRPSLIADFYHRYYRPERATLVAVGDFDPAAMEAKIRARFGDWKAEGPAGPDPDLGQVQAAQDRGQAGRRARRAAQPADHLGARRRT